MKITRDHTTQNQAYVQQIVDHAKWAEQKLEMLWYQPPNIDKTAGSRGKNTEVNY